MEAFKNKLSMDLVRLIAHHLGKQLKYYEANLKLNEHRSCAFDEISFCAKIESQHASLELKQRAQLIADEIHQALPRDLPLRYQIIRGMLHTRAHSNQKISQQSDENGLCGWAMMCLGPVVAQHGLSDFELSLNLLKDMTAYFSCEFDIRPYIIADQEKALNIINSWVEDADYHVRRLASEGTRPRLPWAMQIPSLITDPRPIMPLLTALRDDEQEYVRRSVANHLNDIAKDHPDLVAEIAHSWLKGVSVKHIKNREKLVKHACRTLIKQGHRHTLAAFGLFEANIELDKLCSPKDKVKIGDNFNFEFLLTSKAQKPQQLIIDYVIHHKKANGSLSAKVFKWKTVKLAANESLSATKSHSFKLITTRKYHTGIHALSLRINGQDYGYTEFELTA